MRFLIIDSESHSSFQSFLSFVSYYLLYDNCFRSMTRLNNFDVRPPSSGGLHKSMTKLTSSQQNMARSSSQVVAAPTSMSNAPAARSVTCINNNLSRPHATSMAGFGGPSSLTTSSMASGKVFTSF